MMNTGLTPFHPIIQNWFLETYSKPTNIQEQSWPVIARGDHVLITAPTGSGKTTTLYRALSEVNTRDTKIITVEDPVVPRKVDSIVHPKLNRADRPQIVSYCSSSPPRECFCLRPVIANSKGAEYGLVGCS